MLIYFALDFLFFFDVLRQWSENATRNIETIANFFVPEDRLKLNSTLNGFNPIWITIIEQSAKDSPEQGKFVDCHEN